MHKVLNKNNIPGFVLYVIALLLAFYAIWSFIYCAGVISQAKAAGQLAVSGNEYDIMSFYMVNCGQYFVEALLLAAAGLLLQRGQSARYPAEAERDAEPVPGDSKTDDELDEWFSETMVR